MYLNIIVSLMSIELVAAGSLFEYHVESSSNAECSCLCSGTEMCQKLSNFGKELSSIIDTIEHRSSYINEIRELQEKVVWQDYTLNTLSNEIELLKAVIENNPNSLIPQSLDMQQEDQIQIDSKEENTDISTKKVNEELPNNVSDIVLNVEEAQNLATEVEKELEDERNSHKYLEMIINGTRSSVQLLGELFFNFSNSTDSRISLIEKIVLPTTQNVNETIFEDNLQKLNLEMDGIVHENEPEKVNASLENVPTNLLNESNTNEIRSLSEDLRKMMGALYNLNTTFIEEMAAIETSLAELEMKANILGMNSNISETGSQAFDFDDQKIEKNQKLLNNKSQSPEKLVEVNQASEDLNQLHFSNYSHGFDDDITVFDSESKTCRKTFGDKKCHHSYGIKFYSTKTVPAGKIISGKLLGVFQLKGGLVKFKESTEINLEQ